MPLHHSLIALVDASFGFCTSCSLPCICIGRIVRNAQCNSIGFIAVSLGNWLGSRNICLRHSSIFVVVMWRGVVRYLQSLRTCSVRHLGDQGSNLNDSSDMVSVKLIGMIVQVREETPYCPEWLGWFWSQQRRCRNLACNGFEATKLTWLEVCWEEDTEKVYNASCGCCHCIHLHLHHHIVLERKRHPNSLPPLLRCRHHFR